MIWRGRKSWRKGIASVGLAAAIAALASSPSMAGTVLFSDFTGRVVSGTTVTNIPWTFNGVSDPGDLFAEFPFINSADAQDLIAVNRNLSVSKGGGPWTIDVPLNVLGSALALDTLSLDIYAFNDQFNFHPVKREMDFGFQILDSSNNVIRTGFRDNVHGITSSTFGPWPVSFNISDVTLAANEAYSLRLAFSKNENVDPLSTRAGFDNLSLTGDSVGNVPLPAGLPLALTGLAVFALFRRRRAV